MKNKHRHPTDPLPPTEPPNHMRDTIAACDAQTQRLRTLLTHHPRLDGADMADHALDAITIIRQAAGATP